MLKTWQEYTDSLKYKEDLFRINEGSLFDYVDAELKATFGADSKTYQYARARIPPINVLQKINDKLTQIYNNPPSREVIGSDQDKELFDWYTDQFVIDDRMDLANENYNLTKVSLLMPAFDQFNDIVNLKVVPSHHFLPFGDNPIFPQLMTRLMTYQGEKVKRNGQKVTLFYAYTDYEFVAFTSDGEIDQDVMAYLGNEGVNIYGQIPAVYLQKSRTMLYPLDDTDTKKMTILIPTLLSDLNVASMFSAFSVLYGIDVNEDGLKYAPNAFWSLKSDPSSDKKPEIGTIKNDADIQETLSLIATELGLWLNSKGIRPGAVGDLSAENFISGISKIIDEADAFEARKKQASTFKRVEERGLWPLVMHYMHPVWVRQGLGTNQLFTRESYVNVTFPAQEMLRDRGDRVADLKAEVDSGFTSQKRAVQRLNPDLSAEEIEQLMMEIDGISVIEMEGDEMEGDEQALAVNSKLAKEDIRKETMNGAQVATMAEIVEKVAAGMLPRKSGVNILMVAFGIDQQTAEDVLAEAGNGFKISIGPK
jgi:hypothetical protein